MIAEPADEILTVARNGPVTEIMLNRPHKANALSPCLVERLIETVEAAYVDGTRLLTFRGNGRHFCAGFDFSDIEHTSEGDIGARFLRIETLLQAIHYAPFSTLAMARGTAFGAGADLLAACDERVAAPGTMFRFPGLLFGVLLGTRRLTSRIGSHEARVILSQARSFGAQEAIDIGLLTRVAAPEKWPGLLVEQSESCTHLTAQTAVALRRCTVSDTRDSDMAELARSISKPGLKERIRRFRAAAK